MTPSPSPPCQDSSSSNIQYPLPHKNSQRVPPKLKSVFKQIISPKQKNVTKKTILPMTPSPSAPCQESNQDIQNHLPLICNQHWQASLKTKNIAKKIKSTLHCPPQPLAKNPAEGTQTRRIITNHWHPMTPLSQKPKNVTKTNKPKQAKIYYTSNHIICLDFVWTAT